MYGFKRTSAIRGRWLRGAVVSFIMAANLGNTCSSVNTAILPAGDEGQNGLPLDDGQVLGYRPVRPETGIDLVVEPTPSGPIELSWIDPSSSEEGFMILRSRGGLEAWIEYASLGLNEIYYVDSAVEPGETYCYEIASIDPGGTEWRSGQQCGEAIEAGEMIMDEDPPPPETEPDAQTGAKPPARPSGLQTAAMTPGEIELAWIDGSANEEGFQIERYTSGEGWSAYATVGADITYFYDRDVAPGASHCYRVAAFNAAGASKFTSLKCARALKEKSTANVSSDSAPAAPSRLALETAPEGVRLTWSDNAGNEDGFIIGRYAAGSWSDHAAVEADVTAYTDADVTAGKSYCYRLRAFNAVGVSRPTLIACVSQGAFVLPEELPEEVSDGGDGGNDDDASGGVDDDPCQNGACPLTPAERYAAAGEARRAAGIEAWMFIHPTWLNWLPENYTSAYTRELVDGYLIIMLDRDGTGPTEGFSAGQRVLQSGMRFVPGMRLGPDKFYSEWTDPLTWQKDLDLYRNIQQQFQLADGFPLAVDMEPYWDEQPRYPKKAIVPAMTAAMGEWLDIARDSEMWMYPGSEHDLNVWVLAQARAQQGTVYMLDGSTYKRRGGDDAALEAHIRERMSFMQAHGMEYMPGFYLRHAIDPGLYELLNRCGVKRCWFFCQAANDDYRGFGTVDWMHAQ